VHEHDIRGALDLPGERESVAVALGLDFLAGTFFHIGLLVHGLGPLEVRSGRRTWHPGTGERATGDPDDILHDAIFGEGPAPTSEAPPVGTLEAEPFELFRALTGRRSAEQIRGLGWTTDPDPFLPGFGFAWFDVRSSDLVE
jgi:hypothetical protein